MCSIYRAEFPVIFHFSHIHQEILRYTVQFSADMFLDSSRKRFLFFFLGIKVLLTPGLLCPVLVVQHLIAHQEYIKIKIKKHLHQKYVQDVKKFAVCIFKMMLSIGTCFCV